MNIAADDPLLDYGIPPIAATISSLKRPRF